MIALLIRHGHADPVGKWLAGRRGGISLDATGREQTSELVRALKWMPLTAVYTSPLERAIETAQPLANDHGLEVNVRPALTDVDFGSWTGRSLDDLSHDAAWGEFNRDRIHACAPDGEALSDVQARIVAELMTLSHAHAAETVAIVTHAELIRCALAAFRGSTLDEVLAVDIEPAHVSTIGFTGTVQRVLAVNMPASQIAV